MSRRKLQKFRDNESRKNILQPGSDLFENIKGKWNELYFKNDHNLVLELGCGRGEYTVGLGKAFPGINFIGIDIKGDRIWKGSKTAIQMGLTNVAFLRTQIQQLQDYFDENEVSEIWITFPDPRPKKSDLKRRLTHPRFLGIYRHILIPGGRVHLKTDNDILFQYTLEVLQDLPEATRIESTRDLYQSSLQSPTLEIKTHYEQLFADQGFSIKYLTFIFN